MEVLDRASKIALTDSADPSHVTNSGSAKSLGAYYTDAQIADFLAWWSIRSPTDDILDPCFGGGVFPRSACKRILQLGGSLQSRVFGVEIDSEVHRRITDKLVDEFSLLRPNRSNCDFFALPPAVRSLVDVVIGNPPFIRYQRFRGESRRVALARSLTEGVRFTELCSSWAPFLVHCVAMLRAGGRLAMVVPMEVGHAKYALPLLAHLRESFQAVTFLTSRKKLFPNLNEDTLLVLAEQKRVP